MTYVDCPTSIEANSTYVYEHRHENQEEHSLTEHEIDSKVRYMERLIHTYIEGCNTADTAKITSCFIPEAVHYFPPDMYDGPWRGAAMIAERWVAAVANLGSYWTTDQLIVDPVKNQATTEWTHFKTEEGVILRGTEWFVFDDRTGLIREIRAYYASPQDPGTVKLELGGFDYVKRGYPLAPPVGARQ